ncbi:hypothetical protein SY83_08145 [Paenibacillus swuensis]|uniref:Right handed beta helix domain-containing protein n=1 Tax=Paenibacillus swuensis TaxID=1178515 RepID=A0A172THA5_9BACL|nr:right-handed parallel beta-helix repeat-containing protein [Paenibacillus swuensis]ANE46247.1 hypothetical protein SY83_08145 [Paenibacillus swuensis]
MKTRFTALLVLTILLAAAPAAPIRTTEAAAPGNQVALAVDKGYTLDLKQWNVSNNGEQAKTTTEGINKALVWAGQNGWKKVVLPAGMYLIDRDSRINMVSDMEFELDPKAVIQKETNSMERYETLYIGPGVSNVTLRGGTYRGDKDTHEYKGGGTHESGYGILVEGATNVVIDGVKAENFTGDGICIGAADHYVVSLYPEDFEKGSINHEGKAIDSQIEIRSRILSKTKLKSLNLLNRSALQLARPKNLSVTAMFNLYFYTNTGVLAGKLTQQQFAYSDLIIPPHAAYFRVVFRQAGLKGVQVGVYAQAKSKDIIVRNSEISFNRRQGITVGGADKVLIENNKIHDIAGTAPQSGVDLEGGYFPNSRIRIVRNTFYNNKAYDVILYDGRHAVVDGNTFGSAGAFGLVSTDSFRQALITNNIFKGSNVLMSQEVSFKNNAMEEGWAKFTGPRTVVQNLDMKDSTLTVESNAANGVTLSDIRMVNNRKQDYALVVNGKAVQIKDVTITGPTILRSIAGTGAKGTVFERLTISDYNGYYGLDLPLGMYNRCVFVAGNPDDPDHFDDSNDSGHSGPVANKPGRYEFNKCSFKSHGSGLIIANPETEAVIDQSEFHIESALKKGHAAIYVESANQVWITRNRIQALKLKDPEVALIKLNNYGARGSVSDVSSAIIRGNQIKTNIRAKGISTVDAGIGASSYEISDNVLVKAVLELRAVER